MPENLEEPKLEIIKKYNNFEIREFLAIQAQVRSKKDFRKL